MSEEKPATQVDLREQHKKWLEKYTPIVRRMREQPQLVVEGHGNVTSEKQVNEILEDQQPQGFEEYQKSLNGPRGQVFLTHKDHWFAGYNTSKERYREQLKEMIKKVEDMGSADSYFDDHIYRDEVIELIEAALKNLENK